jgi:hypothetical protein
MTSRSLAMARASSFVKTPVDESAGVMSAAREDVAASARRGPEGVAVLFS